VASFPAAQYVRMSTEHQRFSIENQKIAIDDYARDHGYEVIETYEDPGRSGLTFKGRPGLQRLIADVRSGNFSYRTILVLDVSRWGRFQDTDQAAYYEYMCREAGVAVLYCAEPWGADAGPIASIMKHMKRVMAAEYSRELSTKVSRAQRYQAKLGYKQGGATPLGFRRQVVDEHGHPRFFLGTGEYKGHRGDRVVLVRGPRSEVSLAIKIFELFANDEMRLGQVADWLNKRRKRHPNSDRWTSDSVRRLLTNELYVGRYVFGRSYNNLGRKIPAPKSALVSAMMLAPLISTELFERTQSRLMATTRRYFSDDELVAGMIRLRQEHGRLSLGLVEACPYLPKPVTLRKRFGSLAQAYQKAGYELPSRWKKNSEGVRYSDDELLDHLRSIHAREGYVSGDLIDADGRCPSARYYIRRFGGLGKAFLRAGFAPISSSFRQDLVDRQRRAAAGQLRTRNPNRNRNPDGSLVTDAQLLDSLQRIWNEHGHISVALIKADSLTPTAGYFVRRFGSIMNAYARIGYASTTRQLVSEAWGRRKA